MEEDDGDSDKKPAATRSTADDDGAVDVDAHHDSVPSSETSSDVVSGADRSDSATTQEGGNSEPIGAARHPDHSSPARQRIMDRKEAIASARASVGALGAEASSKRGSSAAGGLKGLRGNGPRASISAAGDSQPGAHAVMPTDASGTALHDDHRRGLRRSAQQRHAKKPPPESSSGGHAAVAKATGTPTGSSESVTPSNQSNNPKGLRRNRETAVKHTQAILPPSFNTDTRNGHSREKRALVEKCSPRPDSGVAQEQSSTNLEEELVEEVQQFPAVVPVQTTQPRPGAFRASGTLDPTTSGLNIDPDSTTDTVAAGRSSAPPEAVPSTETGDVELVQANPVMEDPEDAVDNMMRAEPFNLEDQERKQLMRKKQQQSFISGLVLLFLAAIIIVGSVVGTSRKKKTDQRIQTPSPTQYVSMEPSGVPSSSPTGALDSLFENLPDYTLESLQIFGTPQWKAWNWLSHHQNITYLPDWRKKQLFAMATFFYAFEGEHWPKPLQQRWLDDATEECFWFSSGFGAITESGEYIELLPDDLRKKPPCNGHGQLTSLALIGLQLSGLSPYIPQEIALLSSLLEIDLSYNGIGSSFQEVVPLHVYNMTGLVVLNLVENEMAGKLPTEIGLLTALTYLWLYGNEITGTVPTEIGCVAATEWLFLHRNQFTGHVPTELALMTNLAWIELTNNDLTGRIPTELGLLTSLKNLYLSKNHLTGTIPSEIGLLSSLEKLLLSDNNLTGLIPNQLNFSKVLRLEGNRITGTVPEHLCSYLLCECLANDAPLASTCANLKYVLGWPGMFPPEVSPNGTNQSVMLNIHTDEFFNEVAWWWQQETNVTDGWEALQDSGPAFEKAEFLYSYQLSFDSERTHKLVITDYWQDGFYHNGWMTVTAPNETVLFSLVEAPYAEVVLTLRVGGDGSLVVESLMVS